MHLLNLPPELQLYVREYLSRQDQLVLMNTCTAVKTLLAEVWCRSQAERLAVLYPEHISSLPVCTGRKLVDMFVECCMHGNMRAIKQLVGIPYLKNHMYRGAISIADLVGGSTYVVESRIICVLRYLTTNGFILTCKCMQYPIRSHNIEVMHWQFNRGLKASVLDVVKSNSIQVVRSFVTRTRVRFTAGHLRGAIQTRCNMRVTPDIVVYMLRQPSLHYCIPIIRTLVHLDCSDCNRIALAVESNQWLRDIGAGKKNC